MTSPSTHCIEHLRFEVDFESDDQAFDGQSRTAAFARERAPRIIEEVFDAHAQPGRVWRFASLEVDLGGVDGEDMEPQWEARLRERLAEVLQARQADALGTTDPGPRALAPLDAADTPAAARHDQGLARLETLLHFLRRGHLPWHAGGLAASPESLADAVLGDHAPALVAAWRESRDAHAMARRAARQFSPAWLARLAKALAAALGAGAAAGWGRDAQAWVDGFALLWSQGGLPAMPPPHLLWQGLLDALLADAGAVDRSEPLHSMVRAVAPAAGDQAAVWRALQAVARRAADGTPPAPTATLTDDVLQACLAARLPELGDTGAPDGGAAPGTGSRSDELAHLHARLLAWFDPHAPTDGTDPWQELLRAEPSWARQTLLLLGRGVLARRRMAQALPPAVLHALTGLWLAPAEQGLLQAAMANDALWGPAHTAADPAQRWEMTLSHLLLHPAPALFNGDDYLDGMLRERAERENRPVADLVRPLAAAWRDGAGSLDRTAAPTRAVMQAWLRRRLPADIGAASSPVSVRRERLEAALSQGGLTGVEDAWTEALTDDAPWLQDLLRRVGRSQSLRRRMARGWSESARVQLIGLWLPAPDRAAVIAAVHHPAHAALAAGDTPPELALWEDLLTHLMRLTPGTFFNADAYLRSLRERVAQLQGTGDIADAAPAHPDKPGTTEVDTEGTRPTAAARRARLEAALAIGSLRGVEAAWSHARVHDATWLQHTLRHTARGLPVRRRMAQDWHEAELSQLAGLWLSGPVHALVVQAVHSPRFAALAGMAQAGHPGRARRLWENTIAHLVLGAPDAPFDATAYVHHLLQREADDLGVSVQALAATTAGRLPPAAGPEHPADALLRTVVHGLAGDAATPSPTPRPSEPHPAPAALSESTHPLLRTGPVGRDEAAAFEQQLERLLSQAHSTERRAWISALESPRAAQRLLDLLPARQMGRLLAWLRPADHSAVRESTALIHTACRQLDTPLDTGIATRLHWQFVLRELFEEGRSFDPAGFCVRMARHLVDALRPSQPQRWLASLAAQLGLRAKPPATTAAAAPEAPVAEVMAQALAAAADTPAATPPQAPDDGPVLAEGEAIYIANAGLVLAGAYLQRLFTMLHLAGNDTFADGEAAQRAVHLLQYLAIGADAGSGTPEPQLALNKVLCGLPLDTPVLREVDLAPTEREAVDGLLRAMVAHWKILGNTSVAGLRESFLQREGRLTLDDDGWQLTVEPRSYDMLIDQLPWGYGLLKFPWMERPLHVDWR